MDRIVLLTTPQARWPAGVTSGALVEICLDELDSLLSDASGTVEIWMGYSSPLECLQRALEQHPPLNLPQLLHQWEIQAERFLQERQLRPQQAQLVNLTLLSGSATAALRQRLGCEAGTAPGGQPDAGKLIDSVAAERSSPFSSLAELVIAQRPNLLELYADLEGQAELFEREPRFNLGLAACHDPDLGVRLLEQWQQQALRLQSARTETGQQASQLQQLQQNLQSLETSLRDEVRRSERISGEAAALQQEQADENELLLLQLKQLQEELGTTFASLQSCRETSRVQEQQLGDLEQRYSAMAADLEQLRQECCHLFQHSQLQPGIDRRRITGILDLVRQSMQG